MISSKQTNKEVIKLHKGKPYIETTITLYSPLDEGNELLDNLRLLPISIEKTMKNLNEGVEEILAETFESDIASIYSAVRNLYSTPNEKEKEVK